MRHSQAGQEENNGNYRESLYLFLSGVAGAPFPSFLLLLVPRFLAHFLRCSEPPESAAPTGTASRGRRGREGKKKRGRNVSRESERERTTNHLLLLPCRIVSLSPLPPLSSVSPRLPPPSGRQPSSPAFIFSLSLSFRALSLSLSNALVLPFSVPRATLRVPFSSSFYPYLGLCACTNESIPPRASTTATTTATATAMWTPSSSLPSSLETKAISA